LEGILIKTSLISSFQNLIRNGLTEQA
jgi:hypothetical protein